MKTAYANGVPMGADLPPAKSEAPTFAVWAVKDPTSGNLDRIQIVKELDQERPELRENFRRRLGGLPLARPIYREGDAHRKYGSHRQRLVYQHDRRRGIEDRVERSGIRRQPARLLLRARARDSDAPLDHHPGPSTSRCATGRRARNGPEARMEFAGLVRPLPQTLPKAQDRT